MSSPTHKIVQKTLLSILPHASLEHRFSSIGRIADVALLPEKIIFEIQCSLISISEVEKRTADYASLGFSIIWILHHQTFNKWRAAPVELFLRKFYPCYFTSITPHGLGFIYDQLEFFDSLQRTYKGSPLMIESFLPLSLKKMQKNFPRILKDKKSPLYLPGDLTDHLLKNKKSKWAKEIEKKYTTSRMEKCRHYIRDFFRYLLFINSGRQQKAYEHRHAAMQNTEKLPNKVRSTSLPS